MTKKSNYKTMHIEHYDEILPIALDARSKKAKILLICSGGYDSTSLAYILKHRGYSNVTLLHIDFNQEAEPFESANIKNIANKLGFDFAIEKVNWDMTSVDAFAATTHVGRNGMFVWKAMTKAHCEGYDLVMTGIYELDQPDCRDDFMEHLQKAFHIGYGKNIPILRPLVFSNKVELGKALQAYGLLDEVLDNSYSCYLGEESGACHRCASCLEREEVVKKLKSME